MRKRSLLVAAGACLATLALTVSSAVAEPVAGPDPSPVAKIPAPPPPPKFNCPKNFWAMDLKTGQKLGALLPGSFIQPGTENNPLGQAVVQLDFNTSTGVTCKQANIVVEYEGTPNAWTVDIGDSSTNNGYGGGVPGTTRACAEIQVVTNTVSAYRDCVSGGGSLPLFPNPNPLSLKDGALKFVVRDQYVSVGQPFAAATPASQSFHIPDTLGPSPDGSKIYAAFNRVIYNPGTRVGTGARRIMITME